MLDIVLSYLRAFSHAVPYTQNTVPSVKSWLGWPIPPACAISLPMVTTEAITQYADRDPWRSCAPSQLSLNDDLTPVRSWLRPNWVCGVCKAVIQFLMLQTLLLLREIAKHSCFVLFFLTLYRKKDKIKVISIQFPLPGKYSAILLEIILYFLSTWFNHLFNIFESPPSARCFAACRFRDVEEKFPYSRIIQAESPDQYSCLHSDLKRQCGFFQSFSSAPFPLHADQPNIKGNLKKKFFWSDKGWIFLCLV